MLRIDQIRLLPDEPEAQLPPPRPRKQGGGGLIIKYSRARPIVLPLRQLCRGKFLPC